ncbi:uncharacterized protein LOC121053580 isoform X2 [Oryza brachyantha]|nr:uncharacterized protein LOC121053580 isoform X2 [Oryza brachyantha]
MLLNLGLLENDLALREDPPVEPKLADFMDENDEEYTNLKWAYDEKWPAWEKSNRVSLMYIKSNISPSIIGGIADFDNVKTYLANIESNYKACTKTYASTLIMKMGSSVYDGKKDIRQHIMEMSHMAHQLKTMDMEISEAYLVHFILNSLNSDYDPFKIHYNTQREKWTISELISHAVEEEERQKAKRQKHIDQLNLVNSKGKRKFHQGEASGSKKKGKPPHPPKQGGSKAAQSTAQPSAGPKFKNPHCTFYDSDGHWHKDCPRFKEWLARKGIEWRPDAKKRGAHPKSS